MDDIACTVRQLPTDEIVAAGETAQRISPMNALPADIIATALLKITGEAPKPEHLAVMKTKYWGVKGVKLTVGFMESVSAGFRDKVLLHMNAWRTQHKGKGANVEFVFTNNVSDAQVRIAFERSGYWSYLGTDILHIARNKQTMNLQGFTLNTPQAEWDRVVEHETGHTLGFPHEHMRRAIIERLDIAKTIAWGKQKLGWDEATVRSQILTPVEESNLLGTPVPHEDSIMAYMLPGSITKDGQPIRGGSDITLADAAFAAGIYPLAVEPDPPPPPPPTNGGSVNLFKVIATLIKFIKDNPELIKIITDLFGTLSKATPEELAQLQTLAEEAAAQQPAAQTKGSKKA